MKNADMPANPARVLDPDIATALKENRGDLGLSLQKVREMASLAPGLTKREYFAAMAMQGFLACPDVSATKRHIAIASVTCADELLAALEETS